MREEMIRTSDDRELMMLEVGDPDGYPVLHHHGMPSCRLEIAHHHEQFAEQGLRVIAVDLPGYGQSSPHRGATLGEWASDAARVVDYLEIDSFGVSGYSAGGPSALAVAAAMPARVRQLALVSIEHLDVLGLIPTDAILIEAAARMDPIEFEAFYDSVPPAELPQVELDAASDPADAELLLTVVMESLRQGNIGPASYFWSVVRPWGFAVEDVATPATLWHGGLDELVPPVSSTTYAQHLQNAAVTILPDDTHLTIWRRAPELFSEAFQLG